MKKTINVFLIFCSLFLLNCQNDDLQKSETVVKNPNEYIIDQISFKEVKEKPKAFQKLKEAGMKNASLMGRGEYNEDYGVFVDTTNILLIQKETNHSITFHIIGDDYNRVENLVLKLNQDESYTAYKVSYMFTEEELNQIDNNTIPTNKTPYSVVEMDKVTNGQTSRAEISGPCISSTIVTISICHPHNGDPSITYAPNTYSGGCNGVMEHKTTQIINIDVDCMSGGGGNGDGNGNFGPDMPSNPGSPTNPNTGGGGIIPTPPTPIITTPVLLFAERAFVNGLSREQREWWDDDVNSEEKQGILGYLRENPNDRGFAEEFIQNDIESGLNLNFEKSLASPFFIDLSSVLGNSEEEIIFRQAYESLLKSTRFKELFTNLFGPTPLFNVKFVIEDIPQININGHTNGTCTLYTSGNNPALFNLIKIDREFLLSKPKIDIALVILHECVHAYLNIKFRNPSIGMSIDNINDMDFQECINTYYNGFSGNQTQHSFFMEYMIPVMVKILNDIKSEILTPSQIAAVENPEPNAFIYAVTETTPATINYNIILPWNWNNYFTHLCTNGLENSIAYPLIYPAGSSNLLKRTQYLSIGLFIFIP